MTRAVMAEDLLVRARRGELGEDEARRFDVAVGSSRELKLLYEAGTEFDAQAELLPGDEQRMSALVAGALQELEQTEPAVARRGARRRSDAWFFATSVGFGVLLSVAVASAWQFAERRCGGSALSPPSAPADAQRANELARPSSVSAAPAGLPGPELALPSALGSAQPGVVRVAPASSHGSAKPGAPPQVELAPASPGELFARANEARRNGDRAAAIAGYEALIARHPSSVEAEDARVLLGNLRLSQRSPGAALGDFEEYGAGALTPEALWGRARALRSLASPDERQVLERIVHDYPDSPYANGARTRLQQLAP